MKSKATGVYLSVPANFTVPPELSNCSNEFHYILHRIQASLNNHKHEKKEWVNISKKHLRKFVHPDKEPFVTKHLLDAKVIECNGSYTPGKNGMGYRFSLPYRNQRLKEIECTSPTLASRIMQYRLTRNSIPITEDDLNYTENCLKQWLFQVRLDPYLCLKTIQEVSPESQDQCMMTVNDIDRHHPAYNPMDFKLDQYHRLHTPVTRLLTECRKHLTINQQPLIGIDIRNSQMVFFTLLWLQQAYGTPPAAQPHNGSTPMMYGIQDSQITHLNMLSQQEQVWVKLVMSGQIYDYLMERLGETDRNKTKIAIFADVFYSDTNAKWFKPTKLTNLFAKEFPSIWKFIGEQKQGGYEWLSRNMQAQEAIFMLGAVCGRLCEHHRDAPLITVHDSISTTGEHVETVRRVIMKEFERLCVQPTLKIE